jgi:hypothetical protein
MNKKFPISSFFPQHFLFDFSPALFLPLKPSTTQLNNLSLGHPTGLFPLNSNSSALLGILVLSILLSQENEFW